MITLPELETRAAWSVRVVDADSGAVVAELDPDRQCETASIGKIFVLLEVARRLEDGSLDAGERITIPEEHRVADSGLLYLMRDQAICIEDAALLVGAVSDNLATNALIHVCGLEAVRAVAPALGYAQTSVHDYIRDERLPGMPWTPSYGTAAELADVMKRLSEGSAISPRVSQQVLRWLAADADTSLVADAFLVDPLAHVETDDRGILLRHKTGSVSFARCDVGTLDGPRARVAYAVLANWKGSALDLRAPVIAGMRAVGEELRNHVTGES